MLVLALLAPDRTMQMVVQVLFHALLCVPPPSYVQMLDMEKKQRLLMQEKMVWQQYGRDGMQGQVALSKLSYQVAPAVMPYGMLQGEVVIYPKRWIPFLQIVPDLECQKGTCMLEDVCSMLAVEQLPAPDVSVNKVRFFRIQSGF